MNNFVEEFCVENFIDICFRQWFQVQPQMGQEDEEGGKDVQLESSSSPQDCLIRQ